MVLVSYSSFIRFKPMQVKEIIQKCLDNKLQNQTYYVDKASKFTRELAEEIKQELKGQIAKLSTGTNLILRLYFGG